MKQIWGMTFAIVIISASILGCGSKDQYSSTTTSSSSSSVQSADCGMTTPAQNVTIADYSFTPSSATISPGNVVKWTNSGPSTHSVTSGAPGSPDGLFDTVVPSGSSACLKFNTADTYRYYCRFHTRMTAMVTVQ